MLPVHEVWNINRPHRSNKALFCPITDSVTTPPQGFICSLETSRPSRRMYLTRPRPGPQREVSWFKQYVCSASQVRHVRSTEGFTAQHSIYCWEDVTRGSSQVTAPFTMEHSANKAKNQENVRAVLLNKYTKPSENRHNNKHHRFPIETDEVTSKKDASLISTICSEGPRRFVFETPN